MCRFYTDEEKQWILDNMNIRQWKNVREFCEAFNKQFYCDKSYTAFRRYLTSNNIHIRAKSIEDAYTDEQIKWIKENVDVGIFKNQAQFTQIFNVIFGTSKTTDAMAAYLRKNNLSVSTERMTQQYTDEQKKWISENCNWSDYSTFNDFVKAYNKAFNTHRTRNQLFNYCYKNGIYKKGDIDHVRYFKKGERNETSRTECPIGTIQCVSGRPYVKVQMCEGKVNIVGKGKDNHGYNEPYWKPLQKKIWEDNYGNVPDGYEVCSLNGNKFDENIENIGLIDCRMKGTMALRGWWTENSKLTATAVMWCNLYILAKDKCII